MKTRNCPFCDQETNSDYPVCSNCFKVINNYRGVTVYKPKLKKGSQLLTLDDFKELARSAVESLTGMEDELIHRLEHHAQELLEINFRPTIKALKKARIVDAEMDVELNKSLQGLGYFWSLMNYLLGVEYKAKRLSDLEAKKYLPAISFPFAYHLLEFVNLAVAKGALPAKAAKEKEQEITGNVLAHASLLFEQGGENTNELKPKQLIGELTAFDLELKQLKIT